MELICTHYVCVFSISKRESFSVRGRRTYSLELLEKSPRDSGHPTESTVSRLKKVMVDRNPLGATLIELRDKKRSGSGQGQEVQCSISIQCSAP